MMKLSFAPLRTFIQRVPNPEDEPPRPFGLPVTAKYIKLEKRRPIGRFSLGPAGSLGASPHLFMIQNVGFCPSYHLSVIHSCNIHTQKKQIRDILFHLFTANNLLYKKLLTLTIKQSDCLFHLLNFFNILLSHQFIFR